MHLNKFKSEIARLVQSTDELPVLWRSESDAPLTPYGCYNEELPNELPRSIGACQVIFEQMQFPDLTELARNRRLQKIVELFRPKYDVVYKVPRPDAPGTFDWYVLARWNLAKHTRPKHYWYGFKTYTIETN